MKSIAQAAIPSLRLLRLGYRIVAVGGAKEIPLRSSPLTLQI